MGCKRDPGPWFPTFIGVDVIINLRGRSAGLSDSRLSNYISRRKKTAHARVFNRLMCKSCAGKRDYQPTNLPISKVLHS
jgi:hypothetical protein